MIAVLEEQQTAAPRAGETWIASDPVEVLVVDDHPSVRRGLCQLLDDDPGLVVVADASSAEQAMSIAEQAHVDVVVTDYQLGGRDGIWLTRKLKRLHRAPKVVIYSAYADGLLPAAAVVAEADGLVAKTDLERELVETIYAATRGRVCITSVPFRLTEVIRARLDDQEQAIYGMRLAGIPLDEIARTLSISGGELEAVRGEMIRKLQAPPWSITV